MIAMEESKGIGTREIQKIDLSKSFKSGHTGSVIVEVIYFLKKEYKHRLPLLCLLVCLLNNYSIDAQTESFPGSKCNKVFRAGAAMSNITPQIGTTINGYMQDRQVQDIHDELYARSVVLDDGQTRLAIVVSDLCMVTREVLDRAKHLAQEQTGIPTENMLMSATHTHTAGTAASIFQSDPDEKYLIFLSERIADAVIRANKNLIPARIGWGVGYEPTQVFNRRWKMKQGTPMPNPFGGQDKVVTNPSVGNPAMVEPAGPIDPEVPVISVQSIEGQYIALIANYSLHYVGGTGPAPGEVSADYYGMFADRMEQIMNADEQDSPFVAMMSNGTSGDINNINFRGGQPSLPPYGQMRLVANTLATEVFKVVQNIHYRDWVSLDAEQTEISLGVRLPNSEELERAKGIISKAKGPAMATKEEIYARETVLLDGYPKQMPVILQALRVGDLAITAIPCEVFVEIGLELKKKSPFKPTFNIELANGYNGYLPTPAQHRFGGYETWRARSSYLEVQAAPQITETLLELLDELVASHTQPHERNSSEKEKGFKVLFDGTNLEHWIGNTTDYIIEDGTLVFYPERGGEGNLLTKEEYSDFIFRFEFQLTPGANNGLGIRVPLEGAAAYDGMELQIIDNGADIYKNLEPYQYHGSLYGVIPAERGHLKPVGEWNYQEVIIEGSRIKVILNDEVILDGNTDEVGKNGTIDGKDHPGLKRDKGHIGFLSHESVVKFRNMRIKDLTNGG